jgi:3-phosphoglycerate kinase
LAWLKLWLDSSAISVIGGGESVSAVKKSGLAGKITHISQAAALRWNAGRYRSSQDWPACKTS